MTTDFGGYALPSENGFKVVMAIGAGRRPPSPSSSRPSSPSAARPASPGRRGPRRGADGDRRSGQGLTPHAAPLMTTTPGPGSLGVVAA
ncbi:hypothetical protein [Streptomyces stelliscabiei]|uniref:hypothetical protein n=1 Tax=Streptomyces stelliscabiei TaxID=146820 RepID=UPI002FF1C758